MTPFSMRFGPRSGSDFSDWNDGTWPGLRAAIVNCHSGISAFPSSPLSSSEDEDEACPPLSTHDRYLSIKSTRFDVFFAFAMSLCFMSVLQSVRAAGSLFKHLETKSLKFDVKSPSSVGGGFCLNARHVHIDAPR